MIAGLVLAMVVQAGLPPSSAEFHRLLLDTIARRDDAAIGELAAGAPQRCLRVARDLWRVASRSEGDPGREAFATTIVEALPDGDCKRLAGDELARFAALDSEARSTRGRFEQAIADGDNDGLLQLAESPGEPYLEARALGRLGQRLLAERRWAEAAERLRRAASLNAALCAELELAADFDQLATAETQLGRLVEAVTHLDRVVEVRVRYGDRAAQAALEMRRGTALGLLGRHADATVALDRALAVSRELADHLAEARALEARGLHLSSLGRYADALVDLHRASESWGATGSGADSARVATHLGGLYSELGLERQAHDALDRALETLEGDAERARALIALGLLHLDFGRPREALDALDEAAELSGSDPFGLARLAQQRGRAYLAIDLPEAGLAAFERARAICARAGDAFGTALAEHGRGRALELGGNLDRAEAAYASCVERAGDGVFEALWRSHFGRGRIAESREDWTAALEHYRRAIAIVERLRTELRAPILRARFLGDKLELLYRAARAAARRGSVAEAFRWTEAAKARTLVELSSGIGRSSGRRMQAPEYARLVAVESRLMFLGRQLGELRQAPAMTEVRTAIEREIGRARADHQRARIDLELAEPRAATLAGFAAAATPDAVRAALPRDVALVEYLVGSDRTLAWVLRADRARVVELEVTRDQLRLGVRKLLAPFDALREGAADLGTLRFQARTAATLYQQLLEPLEAELEGTRRLWIVRDGPIRQLPFAALVTRYERRRVDPAVPYAQYLGCRFLVEDRALSYLPLGGLVLVEPRSGAADAPALLVADPTPLPDGAPSLRGARAECTTCGELLPPRPVDFRVGASATEAGIKQAVTSAGVLHFATHAILDATRPEYSRLALASSDTDDGWLHAFEIERLSIRADRVVLSACESAGSVGRGDGLLGLARAFLQAGARNVIATAWVVDDAASAALVGHFYRALKRRPDAGDALRTAQLAILNEARQRRTAWSHPFFWAGFASIGE